MSLVLRVLLAVFGSLAAVIAAVKIYFVLTAPKITKLPMPSSVPIAQKRAALKPDGGSVALVTGGAGFLGAALVVHLLEQKKQYARVVVLDTRPATDEQQAAWKRAAGGDADRVVCLPPLSIAAVNACEALSRLMTTYNIDTVFHVASIVAYSPNVPLMWNVNIVGTANVVNAARRTGVRRLVYTSSINAVYAGGRKLTKASEDDPLLKRYLDYSKSPNIYSWTKGTAEKLVLDSNCDELRTVALRPPGLWGFGDAFMIGHIATHNNPTVSQENTFADLLYIGNAVAAHSDAAAALADNHTEAGGRAFFITDDSAVSMPELWRLVRSKLDPRIPKLECIPVPVCYVLSLTAMFLDWLTHRTMASRSPFLQFRLSALSMAISSYTFDISAAKKALGYKPRYTVEAAMEEVVTLCKQHKQCPPLK